MESRPKLPEIPLDMIKQILSWLPVESLLRFNRVRKEWHSLIQDPGFIKLHTDRAWRGTPVLLPYTRDTDNDSFYLVDYRT
ncbi:hypothetical protein L484_014843 [Morus notabilis]|uniref:F-box domain-containing protein n=1 Tax=Morus notabilis TaxID=981085 RepID=W9R0F1_9ROSA|nr:hypothetical protein L484_014843 [Morus notabilis]